MYLSLVKYKLLHFYLGVGGGGESTVNLFFSLKEVAGILCLT